MSVKLTKYESALSKAKIAMEMQYRIVLIGDGFDVSPYLYGPNDKELEDKCILEYSELFIPRDYDGGYILLSYYSNGEKERFVSSDITSILIKVRNEIHLLSRFRISALEITSSHFKSTILLDWNIPNKNVG